MREAVCVAVRALMLEKLLTRAASQGVKIARVTRSGPREALIETDEAGAGALLALGEKFSLDVRVVARRGAGVWRERLRKRWTLPASMALGALMLALFLSRLWIIDVRAPQGRESEEAVRAAIREAGAVYGRAMRDIDPEALALEIRLRVPELVYAGARKRGVRLLVETARAYAAPDLYEPAAARDLVSAHDALILETDVLAGTPAVKPGDVVRRGQTLIRGEERDGRETTRGVCALGTVRARVWFSGSAQSALSERVLQPTGRAREQVELTAPGWSFPIVQAPPFALEAQSAKRVPIGGLFVPLHLTRTAHRELESRTVRLDEAAVREKIGAQALAEAINRAPKGVSPVDKWVDYSMIEGDCLRARATAEYRLNIAVARSPYTH